MSVYVTEWQVSRKSGDMVLTLETVMISQGDATRAVEGKGPVVLQPEVTGVSREVNLESAASGS